MSDFAAFLSNSPHRGVPWTGHADFPRKSVLIHRRWDNVYEGGGFEAALRIFELEFDATGAPTYTLLTEGQIEEYMGE